MATRFKGEPQELPQYLVEGLLILADQTDEQPWPPSEMSHLLRAMARGCAIRYGNKGYFEVVTRTFHVGLVSEMLSRCCVAARDEFWTQVGEPKETHYFYYLSGTGSTQRRKHSFKYKLILPITQDSSKLKVARYHRLVVDEIQRTLAMHSLEEDGTAGPETPWREDELEVTVSAMDSDTAGSYYRSVHFADVAITVSKERVLRKLGFPLHTE